MRRQRDAWWPGLVARAVGVAAVIVFAVSPALAGVNVQYPDGTHMTSCTAVNIEEAYNVESAGIEGYNAAGQTCIGFIPFEGVHPQTFGFTQPMAKDNFVEMAAILRRYRPGTIHSGMVQWMYISPALFPGLRAAGVNPIALEQWLNELDSGAPWPQGLPKPLVRQNPLTVVGAAHPAAAPQPAPAPKPVVEPKPVAPAQPALPVTHRAVTPAAKVVTRTTGAGVIEPVPAAKASVVHKAAATKAQAAPAAPASVPPASLGHITLPCQAGCLSGSLRHKANPSPRTGWWAAEGWPLLWSAMAAGAVYAGSRALSRGWRRRRARRAAEAAQGR